MADYIGEFYSGDIKYDEKNQPHYLSRSSLRKEECYALYEIIKKYKPVRTLEVGLALGGSAVAIISAKKESGIMETHIVLDPFQKEHSNNVGVKAIKELKLDQQLCLHERFSEEYLDKMFEQKERFDFIFIDGNHTIGQAVTDAFLSDKVLNPGGIIGIHDSCLFSTAASIKYLMMEKKYKVISSNNTKLKNMARQVKYIRKLGVWYCLNVIPYISSSVIFLQKKV